MAYRSEQLNQGTLGSWYNSWDDLWGDITSIVQKAPRVVQQAQTVTQNVPRITQPSIPTSALVYGGLGIAALIVLDDVMKSRR